MAVDLWADSRLTTLRMAAYDGPDAAAATVVVLHGLGSGVDVMRSALPRFDPFAAMAATGLHVLALDWPGHGRSGGARGHLSYRLAMEAAATAIDTAGARWDTPVVVAGFGIGGTLGVYAAIEDTRPVAVVSHGLIDLRDIGPTLRRTRQQALIPAASWLRRRMDDPQRRRIPLPLRAVLAPTDLAFDPRLVRRLTHHPQSVRTYDLGALGSILLSPEDKPSLAALTTPTLVVVGGNDVIFPPTAAAAAAESISGDTRVWVLQAASHDLLLEHPHALLPEVRAFVGGAVAGLTPSPSP